MRVAVWRRRLRYLWQPLPSVTPIRLEHYTGNKPIEVVSFLRVEHYAAAALAAGLAALLAAFCFLVGE